MATISSIGIGSGLDVNSIVSQLVALEKAPLTSLAVKATNTQNQISSFGQRRLAVIFCYAPSWSCCALNNPPERRRKPESKRYRTMIDVKNFS